ncbi:MAG: hypothetical protein EA416_01040, partial [Trueperaceae bacterium]
TTVATPDWRRTGAGLAPGAPDGARRFVAALADVYGDAAASRLQVTLHPDVGHETVPTMMDNCLEWLHRHV